MKNIILSLHQAKWAIFALGVLMCCHLHAQVIPDLYNITLSYQTQSDEERQQLFKQGLLQVIEKITGRAQAENQDKVKQGLDRAPDYVDQYAYSDDGLAIKYNITLVNHLVEQTGQPILGQRRPNGPNIIVWLGVAQGAEQRFIGAETDPALQAFLSQFAEKKGVPVILPLMDIEDLNAVSTSDWGSSFVLQQASQRYGAQVILVGKMIEHPENGQWEGSWQLLTEVEKPVWQARGKSLEEVLAQGLDESTGYLAEHTRLKNVSENVFPQIEKSVNERGSIFIGIEGIFTNADFRSVEAYLQSLAPVVQVNISQILGNMTIFEIILRGENRRQSLQSAISVDHYLVLSQPQETLSQSDLTYRWIGIGTATK